MQPKKVIISPHMDDAALSMGGSILQNTSQIKIITLCASNWTLEGISSDSDKITSIRRAEEQQFINKINAEFVFCNLPEATMRGYNDWTLKCDLNKDKSLFKKIICIINENTNLDDEIYLPAAIGEHVDHTLVFETIKYLNNKNIRIYEDLPYATYGGTTERIEKIRKTYQLTEQLTDITTQIDKKVDCLQIYTSQLTQEDITNVKKYAQNIRKDKKFYERTWIIN
ncbi:MAG: PIG-L family deacetylase [Alphaproteobacteria bacterium]|nr:PIG-L family deacetylase [Alphaproteobacteria bacterium]